MNVRNLTLSEEKNLYVDRATCSRGYAEEKEDLKKFVCSSEAEGKVRC